MVGSAADNNNSREAVGMMALHDSLRRLCLSSDWTYAVFWTIRPRPRVRGGNGCKVGDDNGSLMLMWEDGFCRGKGGGNGMEIGGGGGEGEDAVRRAFSKMSIQLYNYGEGLMGKVAADKCHKWVFKESSDCDPNISSNYWQSSFDAPPPEWTDQFDSGIQTIAVIQAGHGLLQLGSCMIIPEDLHFVLRMRHAFESLGYQSGFYLSQMFSSTRTASLPEHSVARHRPPPLVFNWGGQRQLYSDAASPQPLGSPSFQCNPKFEFPQSNVESRMFLSPQSSEARVGEVILGREEDGGMKWPKGISLFDVLSGPTDDDDEKLMFVPGGLHERMESEGYHHQHSFVVEGKAQQLSCSPPSSLCSQSRCSRESLSLDCHSLSAPPQKMAIDAAAAGCCGGGGRKFQKCFTFPARTVASSSSTSPGEYNGAGVGMITDFMETYLG